jgi:phenylpyruvate tautomerase PptA (4-oxalocrotonate tautomerase family)
MPVIKVWCLPPQTEAELNELHRHIVAAVVSVEELGLKDQNDMTCLFQPDMMHYGLGEEIIVEITGLFEKPERTEEVQRKLATRVGRVIDALFPKTLVECFVYSFAPSQGFWCNRSTST